MGKKSLFTSTTTSPGDGASPAQPKKKRAGKKGDAPAPRESNSSPVQTTDTGPSTEGKKDGRLEPAAVLERSTGCSAPVSPQAQENGNDPLTRLIVGAVGCVAFAVLILLISSSINAERYYVKESRGAVEIWKGDFSPAGKERIMVLHDAEWNMKKKKAYDKQEALTFASRFYVQKAGDLLEAAEGVRDYPRILSYVDKAIALNTDMGNDDHAALLEIVKKDVQEAAILDSGEPETLSMVARKVNDAGHALAGLLFDDSRK